MDRLDLQKLRDLPIEGVAERLGMQVTRHKALCPKALCPFHDDHHASLSFSVRRNTYRCFACGAHGGTIDLTMKLLSKDFLDACRWLAEGSNVVNVTPPITPLSPFGGGQQGAPFDATRYARYFEHPWLNDAARKFLFEERRLDERVVRWCRLTSWKDRQGVPWLQTPYYDRECRLVGIQNRNLVRGALPRFRFHLQPACAQPPAPGRRAVDHRGMLRLLGHALCRPQGHRHSVGHAALEEGHGEIVNDQLPVINFLPHVPRPGRAGRAPLHATAAGAALARSPSAAARLQGLQRLLLV